MKKKLISLSCLASLALSSGYAIAAETEELKILKAEVAKLKEDVQRAIEWKEPSTLIHMAGYSDIGYTDGKHSANGDFSVGSLAPIFHYQYRDFVMLESELSIEIEPNGDTKTVLEYLTIDMFLNDYVTFLGGKFLSPVGQFRQNIHPSWINKLPSAPPGFGHDGAAPVSDIGMQVRGGYPIGGVRSNYSFYISNGPELTTALNGSEYELDGVRGEATNVDADNKKVYGGRFGIIPTAGLEIGVSGATGKATVTAIEGTGGGPLGNEEARDYYVVGFDFAWHLNSFSLRGEFVNTEVGKADTGVSASLGGEWSTWYVQASYQFFPSKFEPVLRYTNYDSIEDSKDQTQIAIGLNYLFNSSVIGKIAYEFNDGVNDGVTNSDVDHDRILVQLAYGF
ncbi:MAG: porin [Gammaproteobacteria bacterium]